MKNKSAKSHILSYCAGSALATLASFSAGQAAADIHAGEAWHTPCGNRIFIRYDSAGFPIWGYSPCGRPIYAYSPGGKPIFLISGIYSGCLVPAWAPRPHYHGLSWPMDVRRAYFLPTGRRHARPLPPSGLRCRSRSPRPRPIMLQSRFHRHR